MRPRVAISAGIGVLVVLGLLGLLAAHRSPPDPTGPATSPAPATAEGIPSEPSTSSPRSDTPTRYAAPGDLRWVDFHGIHVPVSASAGPRHNPTQGAPSGFADSPPGAVMAAVHIALRLDDRFGPKVFGPTVQQRVTGPDAAAALAALQQQYEQDRVASGAPEGEAAGPVYVRLAGFRLDGFTPAAAVVHLLAQGPAETSTGAGYADYRVDLRWAGGDWSMLAPAAGNWDSLVTIATSAAGYTRFGR